MKRLKKSSSILLILFPLSLLITCGDGDDNENDEVQDSPFDNVVRTSTILNGLEISTWMYQIQWLDDNAAIDELDTTPYDMLVVEPGYNFTTDVYDTDYLVSSLKQKPNGDERLLLAYIDIGQAEDYRTYWGGYLAGTNNYSARNPKFHSNQ